MAERKTVEPGFMRKLRVKTQRVEGSGGWQVMQLLQEKRWWGWKTIDYELVPRAVTISLGCVGDTGGWISKFAKYGSFGRDGIIHVHVAACDAAH